MRLGKISENVLKRSVLKQIKTKRKEIIHSAGLGENCAVFTFPEDMCGVTSIHQTIVADKDCARYAIYKATNNLAAAAAEPVAVELALLLPQEFEEQELRAIMEQAEETCQKLHIQLSGGSTKTSKAVSVPIATATGIGMRSKSSLCTPVKPGQDIIVTKWIGLEGTVLLAQKKEQELTQRYPLRFIREAQTYQKCLSVIHEAAIAAKCGASAMHDASEGGIFGALWELGRSAGVGLEVDLKKLPIRQETIEICEFWELNPYELLSGGALVLTADDGAAMVKAFHQADIPAVVVGKVTDNNDRVVINEEERRFLELPKSDEIYKIL